MAGVDAWIQASLRDGSEAVYILVVLYNNGQLNPERIAMVSPAIVPNQSSPYVLASIIQRHTDRRAVRELLRIIKRTSKFDHNFLADLLVHLQVMDVPITQKTKSMILRDPYDGT